MAASATAQNQAEYNDAGDKMGGLTHRTSLPELGHTPLDNRFRKNVAPAQ
jgi:hypothetical protein